MMDYPCDKFSDSFSLFGSIVQTDTQTDKDEWFTVATVVGVNNREMISDDV